MAGDDRKHRNGDLRPSATTVDVYDIKPQKKEEKRDRWVAIILTESFLFAHDSHSDEHGFNNRSWWFIRLLTSLTVGLVVVVLQWRGSMWQSDLVMQWWLRGSKTMAAAELNLGLGLMCILWVEDGGERV